MFVRGYGREIRTRPLTAGLSDRPPEATQVMALGAMLTVGGFLYSRLES